MTMRPIAALTLPDVKPGMSDACVPDFLNVDPRTLLVDESYQRNLSDQSVALIRRIVAEWDWRGFKPPVVAATAKGLHVLDGQHTAIAAATHPDIAEIPVMLVDAGLVTDRAKAFVRHNRDRIQVSQTQLHFALVAAGDEDALTIEQACKRAGARVLKTSPGQDRFAVGDTMAVIMLRALVGRRHAKGTREILQVCVEGMLAPIPAAALKAVEVLLFEPEYAGQVSAESLAVTIRRLAEDAPRQAAIFSAEHKVPIWRGLVAVLFRNTRKVPRGQRAVG